MQEVFCFVNRNLSGAKRRKDASSGERGKGRQPLPRLNAEESRTRTVGGGMPQKLGRKIKQTTSDFVYDPFFGAKTPFQSALTHVDVGQS